MTSQVLMTLPAAGHHRVCVLLVDDQAMIGEAVRAAPAGAAPNLWPVFAALAPLPVLALRGALSDVLSEATFHIVQAISAVTTIGQRSMEFLIREKLL